MLLCSCTVVALCFLLGFSFNYWILTLIDIGALSWNNKNTRNQKCTVKTSKKKKNPEDLF